MKKIIILLSVFLLGTALNSQLIEIYSIGFKKEIGNFAGIEEGSTIIVGESSNPSIYLNYTGMDNILGVHADNDQGKIWIDKFTGTEPSFVNYDSSIKVNISDWGWGGIGDTRYCFFSVICPNIDGIKSIQLRLGAYGEDIEEEMVYGTSYSSYVEISSDPVCVNDPNDSYFRYLYECVMLEINLGLTNQFIFMLTNINWNNIILTYDKSDIRVYADNILIDTQTMGDISGDYANKGLFIGGLNNNSSFASGFTGSVDEVSIFDKVLTVEDRAIIIGGGTVQTAGNCREISNLKAYWRFEETAGSEVIDWAK